MQIEKRVEQRNKYVETIFIGSNGSLNSLILDNYNNNINKNNNNKVLQDNIMYNIKFLQITTIKHGCIDDFLCIHTSNWNNTSFINYCPTFKSMSYITELLNHISVYIKTN